MEDLRKWEEMDIDVLVKIFRCFDIIRLTSGIGQVCSTRRMTACDPLIWKTPDLSMLKSNPIKIPSEPYEYVGDPSDKTLTRILKIALNLSHGNITTLIFHYNQFVSDDQWIYTAERCPRLKRLVIPAWNRIKKNGICKAIRMWEDLESLTMPSISNNPYLIEEIAKNCKKFTELKIMGTCRINFASTLAAFLPNLQVLSIQCSVIYKDALNIILDELKELEVLNISHCVLIEHPLPSPRRVLKELDESILHKARRLHKFIRCMSDWCLTCQHTRHGGGRTMWYKYEANF